MRIGPNHLIFTDPDAWKDIYSHHNGAVVKGEEFEKNMLFYRNRGVQPSILGETRDNHALIRRQLSHGFSEKSLRDQEPIVKGYVDLLMRRLRERCVTMRDAGTERESGFESKTAFDMRRWYTFTTFDVIGDLAFGEPFGCLEQGEANERVTTIEKGLTSQNIGTAVKLLGLERLLEVLVKGRAVFRRNILRQMTDTLRRRMEMSCGRPDLIEGLLRKKEDWVSIIRHSARFSPVIIQKLTSSEYPLQSAQSERYHIGDRRVGDDGDAPFGYHVFASQEPGVLGEGQGRSAV